MSDKLQTIAELMFGYIKVNFVLMKPVLCDDQACIENSDTLCVPLTVWLAVPAVLLVL